MRTCSGFANQLGDYLARFLPTLCRKFVEPSRVLAADSDDTRQLGLRIALVLLDEAAITPVDRRQELVEISGLGI